ncbi:MAG: helix-hairpin-helix domain-containing protein [Acidobacteriota bacterium]
MSCETSSLRSLRTSLLRDLVAAVLLVACALAVAPAFAADLGQVNINTADEAELKLLPRVGPALAQRILTFREENGKFEATEDLILVRGIGEKTFEMLEPFVSTEGESTLTRKVRQSDLEPRDEAPANGDERGRG